MRWTIGETGAPFSACAQLAEVLQTARCRCKATPAKRPGRGPREKGCSPAKSPWQTAPLPTMKPRAGGRRCPKGKGRHATAEKENTMLNYAKAEFQASYGLKSQLPEATGRRWCFPAARMGKSSLINKLCMRKSLARVSATPGKTATINFTGWTQRGLWTCPAMAMPKPAGKNAAAGTRADQQLF